MKKIAYCLYGQPRIYEYGFATINKLVEKYKNKYEFDFFFHANYDESLNGTYYKHSGYRHIENNDLLVKESTINDLIKLYKPKKFHYNIINSFDTDYIVNSKMYNNTPNKDKLNLYNFLSNLYSKYSVKQLLCEYDYNYDIVISSRFDILNEITLDLDKIEKDKLYCNYVSPQKYIADNIIITDYNIYCNYSNAFINLNNIINNDIIRDKIENYGCNYSFVIEPIVTSNIIYYYSNNYKSIITFVNEIPNFY